jgi:hypothetical protein
MRFIKVIGVVLALTLSSSVYSAEMTAKRRGEALDYADGVLSCAVVIRSSFPTNAEVPDGKGGSMKIIDVYLALYSKAESVILTLAPQVTKEDVRDMVAVKNTLWFRFDQEEQRHLLKECVDTLFTNKKEVQ